MEEMLRVYIVVYLSGAHDEVVLAVGEEALLAVSQGDGKLHVVLALSRKVVLTSILQQVRVGRFSHVRVGFGISVVRWATSFTSSMIESQELRIEVEVGVWNWIVRRFDDIFPGNLNVSSILHNACRVVVVKFVVWREWADGGEMRNRVSVYLAVINPENLKFGVEISIGRWVIRRLDNVFTKDEN